MLLHQVLEERSLVPKDGRRFVKEDMVALLSSCEDFQNEQPIVVRDMDALGCEVVFLPKFHCELNPIERVWAMAKAEARALCDYSYPKLRQNVPRCLDKCSPLHIRRFIRKSRDYLRLYARGVSTDQLDIERKIYKSHRRINDITSCSP